LDSRVPATQRIAGKIAAVIVTGGTAEMTTELLRYLTTSYPSLDLLLVECGPEAHQLDASLASVTVLRAGNLGYAGGNNLGFRAALARHADWVVVLNSDAFPLAGSIEALVATLEANPRCGVAGATLLRADPGDGIEVNQGTTFDWSAGRAHCSPPVLVPSCVDFCCGAMLCFRAEALRRVGGFDSGLFLYYEEIDWAERARQAGYSIMVVPAARAVHLGSRTVRRAPRAVAYYSTRNRLIVLRRYGLAHGAPMHLHREVGYLLRALAGHLFHGRWSLAWPLLRGTLEGLTVRSQFCDNPSAALDRQRYEVRDHMPTRPCRRSGARAAIFGRLRGGLEDHPPRPFSVRSPSQAVDGHNLDTSESSIGDHLR
jgi:GT2 family glycosyltransferase